MTTYTSYIPVPVWDGNQWQPRNFGGLEIGDEIIPWPDGFDPSVLIAPPVRLRERVRFQFGRQQMEGEITEIKLHGGAIASYEDEGEEIKRRYAPDQLHLTIYANGHGRWVSIRNIIR